MNGLTERLTRPGTLLRLEGFAGLVACVVYYRHLGGGWGLFALLFLWPDLGALGYIAGPRIGAACYNCLHTLGAPALPLAFGLATDRPPRAGGGDDLVRPYRLRPAPRLRPQGGGGAARARGVGGGRPRAARSPVRYRSPGQIAREEAIPEWLE